MKNPPEVVISGMAGMFPESWNVTEFQKNLFDAVNLVTDDECKWPKGALSVPTALGKTPDPDSFDHSFFGLGIKMAHILDPHYRICYETAITAICDAGINPTDLSGTKTGVISASGTSECEYLVIKVPDTRIMGVSRAMQSNRLAFTLNLTGPSYAIYSSWAGCFEGFRYALDKIRNGSMNAAVIMISNLTYLPESSFHYNQIGRLSNDGCTRCFSDDADGYSRSEASIAFFLQKKEDALRSYGTLVDVAHNYQGSKKAAFIDSAKGRLGSILKDIYKKNNITPDSVGFVEAIGTASKVTDAEELNSLAEVLLEGRKDPLLVGSVKSNAGHTEACADAASIVKALIAANTGLIPPNINYTSPNSLVPALLDGRMKVVTDPTPLRGEIIGVNAMCIAGMFRHAIIKQFSKAGTYCPQVGVLPPDGIPRLFCMTGRKREKTVEALSQVEKMPIDPNFIALSYKLFKKGIRNHIYRGFTILNDNAVENREVHEFFTGQKHPPIWYVFTGMGSQWPGMGTALLKLPIFAKAINYCHKVLQPKGLDLLDIITNPDEHIFDNILHSFVGIAAVQIGLVDVLKELGLVPDGVIGHSVGELGCAYADGCLTAEQMILSAYARGKASIETPLIPGMMAAVGKGYNQIKDLLPDEIDVACHNSHDSCTLSGPAEIMNDFMKHLTEKDIFCRLVNVSNIAYHSRHIKPAAPALLKYLKEVIKEPKARSKKWISTSVPEEMWGTDLAKNCSAEYHTNNLLSSVLFAEASAHIPKNAIIIEISPHGLLQAILKRSFPNAEHIPLTKRGESNGLIFLLNAFGKMYNRGVTLELENLYPPVEYPVPRGTPSLGFLINWEHVRIEYVSLQKLAKECSTKTTNGWTTLDFENKMKDLSEYNLKGVPVVPISVYLAMVINMYKENHKHKEDNEFFFFQLMNVALHNFVEVQHGHAVLYVSFQPGSGKFQVTDEEGIVLNTEIKHIDKFKNNIQTDIIGDVIPINTFYDYLSHIGLNLGPSFRLISEITESREGVKAKVTWNGNLSSFLEAVLLLPVFANRGSNELQLVSKIGLININLNNFSASEQKEMTVIFSKSTRVIECDGIEIHYPEVTPVCTKGKTSCEFLIPRFMPYVSSDTDNFKDFLRRVHDVLVCNFKRVHGAKEKLTILEFLQDLDIHDEIVNIFNKTGINICIKMFLEEKDLQAVPKKQTNDNILVVTGSNQLHNTISFLQNSSHGYLLIKNERLPPGFVTVLSQRIGGHLYSLCSFVQNNPSIYVQMSQNNWESTLQNELNKANSVIYLVGRILSLSHAIYIMQKCNHYCNSNKLRYIFYYQLGVFKPQMYKAHLSKGFVINIINRGEWGTFKFENVNLVPLPKELVRIPLYKFSEIKVRGIDVTSLGLSLSQIDSLNNKIDVIEFSGRIGETNVCGLGTLNEFTKIVEPDSIMTWEKPKNWSHQEISAVILPYIVAYSIIKLYNWDPEVNKKINILVLHGCTPISQAVINLTLKEDYDVFTTYRNETEREFLISQFPMIPEDNLINSETTRLKDILDCKLKENGYSGFSSIVNPLPDQKIFQETNKLLSKMGTYFQASLASDSMNGTVGMMEFLREIAIFGVNTLALMAMNKYQKEILRESFERGLREGVIKPISYSTSSRENFNYSILNTLKKPEYFKERLVVSHTNKMENTPQWFWSNPNDLHLVIVNSKDQLCIHLLEWLVRRNAKNIYVLADSDIPTDFISTRINMVLKAFLNSTVYFNVITKSEGYTILRQHINSIRSRGNISSVFIIGKVEQSMLKSIYDTVEGPRIVYYTSEIDCFFENQIKNGVQIVNQNELHIENCLPFMDGLMTTPEKVIFLENDYHESSSSISIENSSTYGQHIPSTVRELLSLSKSSTSVGWKEVRTKSAREEHCKSLPPILIIPPLKEGSMNRLLKNLFHPAFVATITKNTSIHELAQQLYEDSNKFNYSAFTIICSGWSYEIGLVLTEKMEANGIKVTLIVFEMPLHSRLEKLYDAAHEKVLSDLRKSTLCRNITKSIQTGFEVLKERLDLVTQHNSLLKRKVKGLVVIIREDSIPNDKLKSRLQENSEKDVHSVIIKENDYLEMVNSKKTADFINFISLIETKDSARQLPPKSDLNAFLLCHIDETESQSNMPYCKKMI